MKKIKRLIASVTLAVLACVACNKDQNDLNKVINVSLKANETYSYQIPASDNSNNQLRDSKQASHAASSTLQFKNSNSPLTFQYVPATDFTGTDEVEIGNEGMPAPPSHQGQQHNGGCQGHHQNPEGVSYTFKITVASADALAIR